MLYGRVYVCAQGSMVYVVVEIGFNLLNICGVVSLCLRVCRSCVFSVGGANSENRSFVKPPAPFDLPVFNQIFITVTGAFFPATRYSYSYS